MPELPEVETVCRTLRPHLLGRRIETVEVRDARLRRPVSPDLPRQLVGRRIDGVERRAKYVLVDIGQGEHWAIHLGMSGSLCVGEPPPGLKHVHVRVTLAEGGCLYYRDPRRFGLMVLSRGDEALGELGVEPLSSEFSTDLLWKLRARHRRLSIKSLLMDGRRVAGLGNIYANEILFAARIRPSRRYGRVTRREVESLARAVPRVLKRAIEQGGSSLSDYRDAEGREGDFQRSFRVYGRTGEPCHSCGREIRGVLLNGRSTFYCPGCQS